MTTSYKTGGQDASLSLHTGFLDLAWLCPLSGVCSTASLSQSQRGQCSSPKPLQVSDSWLESIHLGDPLTQHPRLSATLT